MGEYENLHRLVGPSTSVVMLGGGVGASRLASGLCRELDPGALTCIVNTADDHWRYGLRICPDLDTNLYALAGLGDADRGWGLVGETFKTMDRLRELGEQVWFALGDLDLATHLFRTEMLRGGATLTEVTTELASRCGVATRLVPMTDTEVATMVHAEVGALAFEEYFVKREARDQVHDVTFEGIEAADPAPGVLDSIRSADLVVIGPSSPVASLEPILTLPGVTPAIRDRSGPVVAVSPVVHGVPLATEGDVRRARARAALLAARGVEHSPSAIAAWLDGLADVFVIDEADEDESGAIRSLGMQVVCAPTLSRVDGAAIELARAVLEATLGGAGLTGIDQSEQRG